jgi:hypothetical protein
MSSNNNATQKPDNGGPAFPAQPRYMTPDGGWIEHQQGGMTLRDWFAGQVIAGAASFWISRSVSDAIIAKWAYKTADAMIAARKGQNT